MTESNEQEALTTQQETAASAPVEQDGQEKADSSASTFGSGCLKIHTYLAATGACIGAIAVFYVMAAVVPSFTRMFEEMNVDMPGLTVLILDHNMPLAFLSIPIFFASIGTMLLAGYGKCLQTQVIAAVASHLIFWIPVILLLLVTISLFLPLHTITTNIESGP